MECKIFTGTHGIIQHDYNKFLADQKIDVVSTAMSLADGAIPGYVLVVTFTRGPL